MSGTQEDPTSGNVPSDVADDINAPGAATDAPRVNPTAIFQRGETPVSSFTENDKLLYGSFPDLFFLGNGAHKGANSDFKHYLCQADGRFAKDDFLYNI